MVIKQHIPISLNFLTHFKYLKQRTCKLHFHQKSAKRNSLLKAGLQKMFCLVNSLLEQHSSRNRWNSLLTDTCSNYSLDCPVGQPSKLETVPSVHTDAHKKHTVKTLFALDQLEFFMDRLYYQILLLHFNTLCSLYRTAYYIQSCHMLGNSPL